MRKKLKIQVCGSTVCVEDIDYTTPLPMYGEKIPTSCVVRGVKFGKGEAMKIIDYDFAKALVDGIHNLIPTIRVKVVETY